MGTGAKGHSGPGVCARSPRLVLAHDEHGRTLSTGWGRLSLPAPTLTFCDTVLCGQETFLEEALQHGAHGGPVDQLQHEEVGLPGKSVCSAPPLRCPHGRPHVCPKAPFEGQAQERAHDP